MGSTTPDVWNDYVVVGSAGGDFPPYPCVVQGNITALNRTNGEIIWNLRTTTGQWANFSLYFTTHAWLQSLHALLPLISNIEQYD
jgi:outer membrane protein assembly factor BamB